ncbi:hypothetical protein EDD18DRAFT_511438 [Armillaria luteobubalina]|uniref:Uncharacterized protein n=1 Tax=Armillaria luteobubalina TaxID=153913 RepID=A0AA39PXE4_9AGAR|nr:hypothetical protein EDD18DRAFT_511438 [Armillaria luteobubalina]
MDFSSPKSLRSNFLRTIIFTLYALRTIAFMVDWAFNRGTFRNVYFSNYHGLSVALTDNGALWRENYLVGGITGVISTFLVDIIIMWRCWVLWDRQWRVILIPIICTTVGTIMKTMQISSTGNSTKPYPISAQFAANINWPLIYAVLVLATTVTCTVLIIYRIVRHAAGINGFHKLIEMLVESSALYSISLIVYLALVPENMESAEYADLVATYARVIAPTLLVGRLSAHANASSRRQHMVAMWENHPPLVGCFREEVTNNPDDGHQTVLGSSTGKETV